MPTTEAFRGLVCTATGERYDATATGDSDAGAPLEAEYDYDAVDWTGDGLGAERSMWRYGDLLAFEDPVTAGEGGTPLVDANPLATEAEVGALSIKDESRNPTGTRPGTGRGFATPARRRPGSATGFEGYPATPDRAFATLVTRSARSPVVTRDVLVVGGGLAGLVAALTGPLHQRPELLVFVLAPSEAVGGTEDGFHTDAVILPVPPRRAGDNHRVARLERGARDALLAQERGTAPFNAPAHHLPRLLVRRHHLDKGMRVAEVKLHQLAFDLNRLIRVIRRLKRMLRHRRTRQHQRPKRHTDPIP
jgi:threonine synthase